MIWCSSSIRKPESSRCRSPSWPACGARRLRYAPSGCGAAAAGCARPRSRSKAQVPSARRRSRTTRPETEPCEAFSACQLGPPECLWRLRRTRRDPCFLYLSAVSLIFGAEINGVLRDGTARPEGPKTGHGVTELPPPAQRSMLQTDGHRSLYQTSAQIPAGFGMIGDPCAQPCSLSVLAMLAWWRVSTAARSGVGRTNETQHPCGSMWGLSLERLEQPRGNWLVENIRVALAQRLIQARIRLVA